MRRGVDARRRARRLARLVRDHARRALHRDLLDQPGRRRLQGLRPHLPRGAALDRDDAVREARDLAPHHAGRHGLALQPLRRARPRGRSARPGNRSTARPPSAPPHDAARPAPRRAPHRAPGLAGVRRPGRGDRLQHRRHRHGRAHVGHRPRRARVGASVYISIFVGFMGTVLAVGPIAGQLYGAGKLHESGHEAQQAMWLGLALAVPGCLLLLFPEPFLALARSRAGRSRPGCATTSTASPSRCRRRWSSPPFAASTSPSRGRRR